jgi:hypothetical protein
MIMFDKRTPALLLLWWAMARRAIESWSLL